MLGVGEPQWFSEEFVELGDFDEDSLELLPRFQHDLLVVGAFRGDARVETARRDPDTGPFTLKATDRWFSEDRKSHEIALIFKELLVKDYNSLRWVSDVGRKRTISNP